MCRLGSQEERGRNRDEQQRIDEREEHRRRQRQRQRREELPDDALQQGQRDEDDHCRQRRSDDRAHQFVRAALRGHQRGGAAAQMAMDVLHDDNGVVDDESNRNRQAAHRHQVDRPARELQDAEGAQDCERQRDRRDECRPPVAEEEEQHEHCKCAAEDDRVTDAADRVAHERREIVDLRNVHSGRKRAGLLFQRPFHLVGDVDEVSANLPRDVDDGGRFAAAADQRGPVEVPRAPRRCRPHRRASVRETPPRPASHRPGS